MNLGGYSRLYAAAVLFAMTSGCVKLASRHLGGPAVSGIRFAVGIALCVGALVATKGSFKPKRAGFVLLRGIFGAVSMILTYVAIDLTGAGRATVLCNMYPVVVALVAGIVFRERIRPVTVISLALCGIGALVVMRDGSGASLAGDLAAVAAAVLAGFAVNFVRAASAVDSPFLLYLSPCVFGLPSVLIVRGGLATGFDAAGIAFALAGGVLVFFAQVFMASGYKRVPAGKGSVVFYFETALTMLIGVALGERPNARFFLGLALIAGGLVFNTAWRDRPSERPSESNTC